MEPAHSPTISTIVLRIKFVSLVVTVLICALLAACTSIPSHPIQNKEAVDDPVLECQQFYQRFNAIVDSNKVRDAQTSRIDDFPHLQINRFLIAIKPQLTYQTKLNTWLGLLAQLGLETNSVELANLPRAARNQLAEFSPQPLRNMDNDAVLHQCSQTLLKSDLASAAKQKQIVENAGIADNYQTWKRIVGLYPLLALPIAWGIHNWHQDSSAVLKTPTDKLPIKGKLLRYKAVDKPAYGSFEEVKSAIQASSQNPLQIPLPESDIKERLFATFSPLWEVDTVQNDDKIGAPQWRNQADYPTNPSVQHSNTPFFH